MKSDALFSYQPPFNILAFLILKPASWFLSPRALHSVNVFLIKVTSLPQLLAITVYERYLKSGGKIRQTGKDAAQSFFNRLPKQIKYMPLLEALVGSTHNDIYDAILDMEVDETDFFAELEDVEDVPILSNRHSRENLTVAVGQGQPQGTTLEPPPSSPTGSKRRMPIHRRATSTTRLTVNPNVLPRPSPLSPSASTAEQKIGGEGYGTVSSGSGLLGVEFPFPRPGNGNGSSGLMSPLARLFSHRTSVASSIADQTLVMAGADANPNVRKVETLLEEVKALPVGKLKEEMRELQVGYRFSSTGLMIVLITSNAGTSSKD